MNSVVDVLRNKAVGIIMTGMGNDGQIGLEKLAEAGGYVIAQEPESCVVAGMPRSVIDNKICHEIQPLHNIAGTIAALFNK
jgi:two-component system chemotaxis response regulator CheB